jgi:KTSC domain-containing protein
VKRQAVRSSAIRSIGYDPQQRILEVEFTDDTIYEFLPVPAELVGALLAAESKGTFFDERIRNSYIHRQVLDEDSGRG